MSKSGGPATLYGVLYQLLGAVEWSSRLALNATFKDENLQSARLIIEPRSGGDLIAELESTRIVEQWKSNRTGNNWTIRKVIENVIPDLFRSIQSDWLSQPTQFRFCSEGRMSDWSAARSFFERLRAYEPSKFSRESLDNVEMSPFMGGNNGTLSDLEFFAWIVEQIRETERRRGVADHGDDVDQKVAYLLSNFDVPLPRTASEIESEIDRLLRDWVECPNPEDVAAKRKELCGNLLTRVKSTDTVINPRAFLRSAGLTAIPLKNWSLIVGRCFERAWANAGQLINYRKVEDVRQPPQWFPEKSILVLAGEGGAGKSWQLASLLRECFRSGSAVVFFRSRGDITKDLTEASRLFWNEGTEHFGTSDLFQIRQRIQLVESDIPTPWLTIFIDDVLTMDEIRSLLEQPWEAFGVKVALSVPLDIGRMLDLQRNERVQIVDVPPLTESELREYLRQRGRDWSAIPADVREQIRRPLLARLYCDLNPTISWQPHSEYEVFSEVWKLLRTHPLQADHPDDYVSLRDLVGTLFDPDASYPWTVQQCRRAGLDADTVTRLSRVGWLNRAEDRVEVWHNRLLNWAAAEYLFSVIMNADAGGLDECKRIILDVIGTEKRVKERHLGYVLMDLLWLMTGNGATATSDTVQILRACEDVIDRRRFPKELYLELLPTLGNRIVDALVGRMESADSETDPFLPNLVAKALMKIGDNQATDALLVLLQSTNECAVEAGARGLKRLPRVEAVKFLWDKYKQLEKTNGDDPKEDSRNRRSIRLAATQDALLACGVLAPDWVHETILIDGTIRRNAWMLAEILHRIDDESAAAIWESTREILIEALKDGADPLGLCIRRFHDTRCINLLKDWATSGVGRQVVPGFCALAVVSPDDAISLIPKMDVATIAFNDRWALDELFLRDPDRTRQQLREFMRVDPHNAAFSAPVYSHRGWRLDGETLQTLFCALEELLALREPEEREHENALYRLLQALGRVTSPDALGEFLRHRESPIEYKLAAAAESWMENGTHSASKEHVGDVLRRFCGPGITRFVNAKLKSSDQMTQLNAIKQACIRPDEMTIRTLVEITESDELYEQSHPKSQILQSEAIEALAALGEDGAVIQGMIHNGTDGAAVAHIRSHLAPMNDESLNPAINSLNSDDSEIRGRAITAIGVSGRRDMINILHEQGRKAALCSGEQLNVLWALYALEARDEHSISLFRQGLSVSEHRFISTLALLQTDTAETRQVVADSFANESPNHVFGNGDWLAPALFKHEDTREVALNFAWASMNQKPFRAHFRNLELLEMLGDLGKSDVTDYLLQESNPMQMRTRTAGRRRAAILALAKHDRGAAVESAWTALRTDKKEREMYPPLLMEFAPNDSVWPLAEMLVKERNQRVRRAIGVAIRHFADRADVEIAVCRLLAGGADHRSAAALLIQWMGDGFMTPELPALVDKERFPFVRTTFLHAIAAHEAEQVGKVLLERIPAESETEKWCLVEVLFDLLPPECLGSDRDPLWVGPILDSISPILEHRMNERYRDALKDLERDLNQLNDD